MTRSSAAFLNPEELGEVKLELAVEKDQVRAHLHAQSSQVHEVLEKHIARLREALELQGLKLDEVRISSDSQGGESRFSQQQQSSEQNRFPSFSARGSRPAWEEESLPAYRPETVPQGLSLRV